MHTMTFFLVSDTICPQFAHYEVGRIAKQKFFSSSSIDLTTEQKEKIEFIKKDPNYRDNGDGKPEANRDTGNRTLIYPNKNALKRC